MTSRRWTLLGLLVLLTGLPACADGDAATNTGATKGSEEIVAYAGDTPIKRAEIEDKIAAQLQEMRQQEYELHRDAIRGVILERMVEERAAAEGMEPQAYVEREVRARAAEPTDAEIEQIYNQYKDQPALQGKSLEEAKAVILPQLERQKLGEAQSQYVEELLAEANIRLLIEPPRTDVAIPAGEPSKGPADAPVTLVEFSDFQCGYCKRVHPTIQALLEDYGDQVRFVYRDYWIPNHTRAKASAEAARCAGDQGKYWEYFDDLMENPGSLDDTDLRQRATDLGLDVAAFDACLESDKFIPAIEKSHEAATELGIAGTPTFFVNGRRLVGAKPAEEFRALIDEELERAGAKKASS